MAGLLCAFDVIGDLGFPVFAQVGTVKVEIDYSEGTELFLDVFEATAVDLVPVDTGALQDSIWADGGDTYIECWAEEDYASFVEFGTWKMYAQPYFCPALEAAFSEALDVWVGAVEEAEDEAAEEYAEILAEQEQGGGGGGADSLGGFLGMLLAALIMAIIDTFIQMFTNPDAFWSSSSSASDRGYGGVDITAFVEEV